MDREGRGRKRRQDQPQCIGKSADDNRAPIADFLGQCAEKRLADAPGEVLDGDGQRKLGPGPAELVGDGKLEHAERGPHGETQKHDEAADNQNWREKRRGTLHGADLVLNVRAGQIRNRDAGHKIR